MALGRNAGFGNIARNRNAGFANYLLQDQGPPIEGSAVDPNQGGTYTPGTPGAPGYTPDMASAQFPLPPGGQMPPPIDITGYTANMVEPGYAPMPPAGGVPSVEQNLPPYSQSGTGGQMLFTGGASQSGSGLTPFLQSLNSDAVPFVGADPSMYYNQYATQWLGMDPSSGNYALGAANAAGMPYEWMMTPGGQNLFGDQAAMYQFYEDNIQDGMNPGTEYYTTGDFIGQAFGQGTRMFDYIFGPAIQDGQAVPKSNDQIMSDLFTAMEMVLGPTMAPQTLDSLMQMYAAAYSEYLNQMFQAGSQAGSMSLYQWFESQGLGTSMLGGI